MIGTGFAIAQDGLGHVAVTGQTWADNLPVTPDGAQVNFAGNGDAFLVELSGDGRSELYGTYLGSADFS